MSYWRDREGPLPSSDSRNYSETEWARRDAEAKLLCNRFPLPRGTSLPLTPLRPIELQAALILPETESRAALLRSLEYFGARRIEPSAPDSQQQRLAMGRSDATSSAGAASVDASRADAAPLGVLSLDDALLEVRFGVGAMAKRKLVRAASVDLRELATASVMCVAEADLDGTNVTAARASVQTPQGATLLSWFDSAYDELALIREWRARPPELENARHAATAVASYLLYKNPSAHEVTVPLPAQRANQLVAHLVTHREERDARATMDVVAVLEQHAPREHVMTLIDTLECWLFLGKGLVMS